MNHRIRKIIGQTTGMLGLAILIVAACLVKAGDWIEGGN